MSIGKMRALGRCGKGRGFKMLRKREGTVNTEEREGCFGKEKGASRGFIGNKGGRERERGI